MAGDPYVCMHQNMLERFAAWQDEMSLRTWGFRYSELLRIETAIARTHSAAVAGSKEAAEECERLTAEYREIWLPCRHRMEK